MKTKWILILVCLNISLFAQDLVIKSLKLDSLIFNEINNYRISFGSLIVKKMDNDNLML